MRRGAGRLFLKAVCAAFLLTVFMLAAAEGQERSAGGVGESAPAEMAAESAAAVAENEMAAVAEDEVKAVPLPFRRIYVPAEMMESIPNRGEPYWPVEAEKFEKWVRDVKAGEVPAEDADTDLTVRAAYYKAVFSHGCLADGAAVAVLGRQGEMPARQAEFSWRFQAGSLAISRMTRVPDVAFQDYDALAAFADAHKSAENVASGRGNDGGGNENRAVFYPDGTAEMTFPPAELNAGSECTVFFQWTQRARQTADGTAGGAAVFDLNFFPCLDITLDLILPAGKIPVVSHGQTRRVRNVSPSGGGGSAGSAGSAAESPVLWRFYFGGHHHVTLKILASAAPEAFYPLQVAQENRASFHKNGLNFTARLELDMPDASEPGAGEAAASVFLKAQVDTRLALTDVTYKRRPVAWTYVPSAEEAPAEEPRFMPRYAEILLEIPEKVRGVGNILEFHAVENPAGPWEVNPQRTRRMPPVGGAAERENVSGGNVIYRSDRLTVPKIRVQNVFWSEGKSVIRVYEPFMMTDISPAGGRILSSRQEELVQNRQQIGMTEMVVQEFTEDTEIAVALASVQAEVTVQAATVMDFRQTEISAVMELSFSIHDGERFMLMALVDPDWAVDSVESAAGVTAGGAESAPGAVIEDWAVEKSENAREYAQRLLERAPAVQAAYARAGKEPVLVRVQLLRALKPGEDVALRVRMRRPGVAAGREFTAAEMAPVVFPLYKYDAAWFLAGASYAWQLKLSDGVNMAEKTPVEEVPAESVLARARAAHEASFFQVVTRLDARNTPAVRVEDWPAMYDADITGFYDLSSPAQAVAVFTVECRPRNSAVERVQVLVRPAVFFDVTWKFPKTLEGSVARCLEKVPLDTEGNLGNSQEKWEITLSTPQTQAFQFEMLLLPQELSEGGKNGGDVPEMRLSAFYDLLERFPSGVPLNLVALPDARRSTAAVALREEVSGNVTVTQQRMTPVLTCPETVTAPWVAAVGMTRHFQYAPETLSSRVYMPFLKLLPAKKPEQEIRAWVWRQQRQSQFFPSGLALHVVSWNVENTGEEEFRFHTHGILRKDTHILGVLVDGQRVPEDTWREKTGGEIKAGGEIRITLPRWKRQVNVTLQWMEKNAPLDVMASVDAPVPEVNFPVLHSSWKVWVPDNYTPMNAPEDVFLRADARSPGGNAGTPAAEEAESARTNTVLSRFFGELASGGDMFYAETRDSSLGTLWDTDSGSRAFLVDDRQWLSLVAISHGAGPAHGMNPAEWDFRTGWTPYLMQDRKELRIIHSSALEASRWFLMLVTFLVFSCYFRQYRALRIGLCGLSAALCLVVPAVFAPIFAGIFFGFVLSFALHSALRRRKRMQDRLPKVIHVYIPPRSEKKTTRQRPVRAVPLVTVTPGASAGNGASPASSTDGKGSR